MDAEGEIFCAHRLIKRQEPRMIEHVVAGGSEHHHRHRAEGFRFMHLAHRRGDIIEINHRRPLQALVTGKSVAHPAVK